MPSDEEYAAMAKGREKVCGVCDQCGMKFYTVDAKTIHKCPKDKRQHLGTVKWYNPWRITIFND